jgi:hypothetical protein
MMFANKGDIIKDPFAGIRDNRPATRRLPYQPSLQTFVRARRSRTYTANSSCFKSSGSSPNKAEGCSSVKVTRRGLHHEPNSGIHESLTRTSFRYVPLVTTVARCSSIGLVHVRRYYRSTVESHHPQHVQFQQFARTPVQVLSTGPPFLAPAWFQLQCLQPAVSSYPPLQPPLDNRSSRRAVSGILQTFQVTKWN